jgi:hypothetical protein
MNYLVVLFKNRKRKKIIKSFVRKNYAEKFFKDKIDESNQVKFNVEVENSEDCKYEIGFLSLTDDKQIPLFVQDEFGRNVKIDLEDSDYKITNIFDYNLPEKIQDCQKNKRITYDEFFKSYFSDRELKNVFTINNKVVIQKDENIMLFSFKNQNESKRFMKVLQEDLVSQKRADGIFVTDNDTVQRKYIYTLLEQYGVDRKKLYRQSTTFSKRK